MSYEQLFLDNLALIEGVIGQVCRRHRASDDEKEEFRSLTLIKLIENDYFVLRDHRGTSSMRGYLTSVLLNAFRDYRNSRWGKWRPSKEAKRGKSVAVLLEQLTARDGYTFDEAVQILRTNHHVTEPRDELWAFYLRFPARVNRRPVGEQALMYVRDPGVTPDEALENSERAERRAAAYQILARVLQEFAARDRLILKLHFFDGWKLIDIARRLGEAQKQFYPLCADVLARLRARLREEGVDLKDFGI